jgi:hypothetical protein
MASDRQNRWGQAGIKFNPHLPIQVVKFKERVENLCSYLNVYIVRVFFMLHSIMSCVFSSVSILIKGVPPLHHD